MTRTSRGLAAAAAVACIATAMLTGCSSDDDPTTPTSPASTTPGTSAGPVDLSMCEPGPDKVVTMLDDVVIAAQDISAVSPGEVTIGDETVTIPGVDAVVIPERVGEGGCVVRYKAPGGCLGAVEISGAYIPAYTIPERRLPAVQMPGGTVLEEVVLPERTIEAVAVAGARQDQVCQVTRETKNGDHVAAVSRPAVSRPAVSQSAASQAAASRAATSVDGDYVSSVYVPSVYAPSVYVPSQYVASGYLASRYLDDTDVETTTDEDTTSYTAQGDVLFDSDQDVLRAEAEPGLKAILDQIQARPESATILVEGHTDDVDTEEHNLSLSQRRADAVAAWLVAHGLDESRITTVGHGLAYPRADNTTDEGRALNRRVVITVTG